MGARGPYAPGVARREELIRAALQVFATRGYEAVSLRELAAQVGISHTGLRHHFASKEELLMAVLRYRDEQALEPEKAEGVTGMDWLRASEQVVAHNVRQPHLVQLFATLSTAASEPSHPAHAYFVKRYAQGREIAAKHVRAAQEAGQIGADVDPELVSQLFLATMDGLQIQWLLDPEAVDMTAAYGQFLSRFIDALTATVPAS
ncbi:DNA-binding transcriptional regulator, AcrR family [Amycolatopsis xylanica]|uniref:DNA-binding transcriptional regulator, AcrR family n=1 Tax=Amycolatopsis xylanica TaxID=589385 RepID=A0A1H2TGN9_9PSEU|nr:TetR/AcrR family transcriptional regulator [Amycolatopsis xylanica]SDW42444.1 DNA-binding transcriptional regulator, AcrR family [Amycolatopsis xylanica]